MTEHTHPHLASACRAAGLPISERYRLSAVRRLLFMGSGAWRRMEQTGTTPEVTRVTPRIAWVGADALEAYLAARTLTPRAG